MRGSDLRKTFLAFFEKRGHAVMPSASLLPRDKTLLFNIAGMVPFKPYFLGEVAPPHPRATTSQKCIRTNDIEKVGTTARHLTFFEMLGNFSFGDYFKREAIGWAWEFLTGALSLPKDRLYASIYREDEESFRLWKEIAGLKEDRIIRLGKEGNFWEVGPTGPCGPCSELLYDQGPEFSCGKPDCAPGCDCDRYLEVWNLVFMEYNQADGKLHPLPKKNIDTGMGLERLAAILQNKKSNFDTDLLYPLIEAAEALSTGGVTGRARRVALNVIADHTRAVSFLLADGARPSNEDRGYVVRRLIRRAAAAMHKLGVSGPALYKLAPRVVEMFVDPYGELRKESKQIESELRAEEERFAKTLDVGLERLTRAVADLRKDGRKILPGGTAFELFDTYGFPLDLTQEVLLEQGCSVDLAGFTREMDAQKTRARAAWEADHGGAEAIFVSIPEATVFDGYEKLSVDARVVKIVKAGAFVESAAEGESVEIVFDRTPFYAERGGQVGDSGIARSSEAEVVVESCMPVGVVSVHRSKISKGRIQTGRPIRLEVDPARRAAILRNHTGTHLLHAVLRGLLGESVHQAGSLVSPDLLRFDFTAKSGLGDRAAEVELQVNDLILKNLPVRVDEMTMEKARGTGAMMLFDEKYGDRVRVVTVGSGESVELCGGTHCAATGEIGLFKIVSETAIAAGTRRIVAVTGRAAVEHVQAMAGRIRDAESALKVPIADVPAFVEKIQKEKKDLEKKLKEAKRGGGPSPDDFLAGKETRGDLNFIVADAGDLDMETLRGLAERLRDKISGPVFLAARSGGVAQLVMAVPKNFTDKIHAGKIIAEAAAAVGGKGGGRPDFAQAGGKDAANLDRALSTVRKLIAG
ncbi:alanine--tRNA ligase [bacterium]|nr:alanine--tRNA ligase [bacterium]